MNPFPNLHRLAADRSLDRREALPSAGNAHCSGYRLAPVGRLSVSRPSRNHHRFLAMTLVATGVLTTACTALRADVADGPLLTNVRQLTRPDMGFEKAGEAYFSPDAKRVIFQAVPKGLEHYQIFTINIDGTGLRRVSTGKGETTCGYFHPDGKHILFASSHLDPGIGQPRKEPASKPGYQRGSGRYVWHFNEHMDIFTADLDGSNLRRVTTAKGYDAEGAYSRDGKMIAFASYRTGDMEIYTMNADGSNVRRLTRTPGYDGGPFISPDGKRIIFRADRERNDMLQLFVMDIDGKNERQLTDNEAVNWGPYWHPTGRYAAFATSLQGHHNYEIYLIEVDTGRLSRVTHTPGPDVLPVFSPDGRKMMWTSKRGPDKTSQVFVADFQPEHAFSEHP